MKKKKIHSKLRKSPFVLSRLIMIFVLTMMITGSLTASAETRKVFKPVSEENTERSISAEAVNNEKTEEQQKEEQTSNQKDKAQKNQKKRATLKKANKSETETAEPLKAEEESQIMESALQEPAYEVLTDIRCILLGILMISGLITGIVLSHSFQRGIKK